jgi:hypothetical protein
MPTRRSLVRGLFAAPAVIAAERLEAAYIMCKERPPRPTREERIAAEEALEKSDAPPKRPRDRIGQPKKREGPCDPTPRIE